MAEVRPAGGAIVRAPRFAVPESVLASRERVLRVIAERFGELSSPAGRSGEHGSGERFGLMPHEPRCLLLESASVTRSAERIRTPRCTCAFRSVEEFGRLLRAMRPMLAPVYAVWSEREREWLLADVRAYSAARVAGRRVLKLPAQTARWHLVHWWIQVERVQKLRTVERRGKNGKRLRLLEPAIVVRRDSGADERKARLAVAWMAREWGLEVEPMLPEEIRGVA